MEAVAAIASVAGIVSLVGRTLEGIIKLRGFYQDISEASNSVARFLKALSGLIQIHEDVGSLVRKLDGSTSVEANRNILASLQIQIDDCGKDVGIWLEKASTCQPLYGPGTRSSFRKFLAALEKKKIVDIHQEIENHKNSISTKLSVIGRHMDIDHSVVLGRIATKIDQVAVSQKLAMADSTTTWGVNDRFDNTPASLCSIASSLNRIEHALSSRQGSFGSPASPYTPYNEPGNNSLPFSRAAHHLGDTLPPVFTSHHSESFSPAPTTEYYCDFFDCTGCFSSAALLQDHKIKDHGMLYKDGGPFLCSYSGCENSLPGNSFYLHSSLRVHLIRRHSDNNLPEILTKESSFEKLEGMFFEKLGCCFPSPMDEYIRLIVNQSRMKTSHDGLSDLSWLFSEETGQDESFNDLERLSTKATQRLQNDIERARGACWKVGQNVDDVDIMLKVREYYISRTLSESPQKEKAKQEDDCPILQGRLEGERTKLGASKMDRINLWLLENLLQSPSEIIHHRSYLQKNFYDDRQDWGRAVLKHWLLDGAATEQPDQAISTNGAVDSAGSCHSARVVFESSLPFPIAEPENGVPAETAGQGILARETFAVDDRMSWGSEYSARSLAHRQKRRKREHSR